MDDWDDFGDDYMLDLATKQADFESFYGIDESSYFVVSKDGCPYCVRAIRLLEERNESVTVRKLVTEEQKVAHRARYSPATVPQIYHMGVRVGGFEELERFLR